MPIYVAEGSADERSHPRLFQHGQVAGVPPDAFSATGQLWGNPIYDWGAVRAEDLGVITEPVTRLRRELGFPGMLVLQFAWDGGRDNPYLPEHHVHDAVVYTGTHDNDTTRGWWDKLDDARRARTGLAWDDPVWSMI